MPKTINVNSKKDIITISEEGHSWVVYDFEKNMRENPHFHTVVNVNDIV